MRKPIIPQGSQPEKGEAKESFTTEPKSFGHDEQIAQDGSTQQPRTSLLGWEEIKLKRPCFCGCEYAWAIPRSDTIHHAALHCQACERFNGWQPKPQAQGGAR
jgi:hypothetical protein